TVARIRTISETSFASAIRSSDKRRVSVVVAAKARWLFSENLTASSSSLSGRSGPPRLISTSSTIRLPSFVVTDRIAGACCGKMESQCASLVTDILGISRSPGRITDQLIGEVIDAQPQATAPDQGRCHRVGTAKLGLISGLRRLLAVQRLPYRVEHRGSDGQLCGRDFASLETPLAQRQRRVNSGVGIVVGWVRLKAQAANFPSLAQSFRQQCGVERPVSEATIDAVPPLECLGRSVYAGFRETCRLDGRFGSPAGLETLDRAARPVGFQRAAGEAHSDRDRVRSSAGFE